MIVLKMTSKTAESGTPDHGPTGGGMADSRMTAGGTAGDATTGDGTIGDMTNIAGRPLAS